PIQSNESGTLPSVQTLWPQVPEHEPSSSEPFAHCAMPLTPAGPRSGGVSQRKSPVDEHAARVSEPYSHSNVCASPKKWPSSCTTSVSYAPAFTQMGPKK